jgi:hypothetical protein
LDEKLEHTLLAVLLKAADAVVDETARLMGRRAHKSTTLIDVRLAPTSGAKADIS